MATTYEQFIAFGTDNAGLERTLRLFQAVFMIFTGFPSLIASALFSSPARVHVAAETSLIQLQGRLGLTRRWLRTFRFLEALLAGWKLYLSENKTLETWLDAHSKTCLGLFQMLETVTLLDLLSVDHLEIFGPGRTKSLNLDAQKFWFVALYLSAMSTGVRLIRLFAHRPVPAEVLSVDDMDEKKSSAKKAAESKKGKEEQLARQKKFNDDVTALGLKLVSDVLDLSIPASIVGWIQINPGLVGVAMTITTLITGNEVWKKCGRELALRKA